MAKKLFSIGFFFILSLLTVLFFGNCSRDVSNFPVTYESAIEKLSVDHFSLDGSSYAVENYALSGTDGPVYFQIIPGCADRCPVVVVSMPYNGISWTTNPDDVRWANGLPTGGLALDVDGPGYVTGSGQQIPYYNSSVPQTVGSAGLFLPSGVTVVLIYSRFYLGRKMNQYVSDFVQVVNSLKKFSFVDLNKMGFLGSSLGGFISLHASRFVGVKPLAIAGITPLIDLKSEQLEMSSVAARITSNPILLSSSENFFNSYLRRMVGVDLDQYASSRLASDNTESKILVIHDTWDTIVSINQYLTLQALRPVDGFIFQHASNINFNTFTLDHAQSIEGFSHEKIIPVYMAYLLNRLKPANEDKIIFYSSADFLTAVSEVKLAHDRGQNISWFRNFISDLCTSGFYLKDYATSGNLGTLTGVQMAGGIITNIWNRPTSVANGCAYLIANPNMFK